MAIEVVSFHEIKIWFNRGIGYIVRAVIRDHKAEGFITPSLSVPSMHEIFTRKFDLFAQLGILIMNVMTTVPQENYRTFFKSIHEGIKNSLVR